jgi:GT2 family glycosyltransferase
MATGAQPNASVSIIICTYTEARWESLLAAIESVRRQSTAPLEILVVVDHNPALLQRAREEIHGVTVLSNGGPQGLSGARNSGIAASNGELVAFLDDDAVAEPDWLTWLSTHCQRDDVLGAGGAAEPRWDRQRPRWFPEEFGWVVGCSYRGLPTGTARVRNLYGGCACIRRDVFDTVGGFRTDLGRVGDYPAGCEETELCIRARRQWPRASFIYEPRARIHHHVPPSRATLSYFLRRCFAEGLSKARTSRLAGAGRGLAVERVYALRTLPRGVFSGLADAIGRGEAAGILRAGAIVVGFVTTCAGFGIGLLSAETPQRLSRTGHPCLSRRHNSAGASSRSAVASVNRAETVGWIDAEPAESLRPAMLLE